MIEKPSSRDPRTPVHRLIQDDLKARIRSGEWGNSGRIPSTTALVREYAAKLGRPTLAASTVRQAIIEMRARGELMGVIGSGVFVVGEDDED